MDLFPLSEETLQTMSREQLIAVVLASQKLHPPRLQPLIPIGHASRRRIPKRGGQAVRRAYPMKDVICCSCGSAHAPSTSFDCYECGECFCDNCENGPIDLKTVYRICKACRSKATETMPEHASARCLPYCTLCNTVCDDFKRYKSGWIVCLECQNILHSKPLFKCTFCISTSAFICRICKKELCVDCEDFNFSASQNKPISNGDLVCWNCHKDQLKKIEPVLKPLQSCSLCKKIPLDAYICHKCGILLCHECQDILATEPSDQHFCRKCGGMIKRGAVGAA